MIDGFMNFFWATRLPTNVFDWLAFSRGIN